MADGRGKGKHTRFVRQVQDEYQAANEKGRGDIKGGKEKRPPLRFSGRNRKPPAQSENGGGRPREYNREEILDRLEKYIAETEVPILKEFAGKINMPFESLRELYLNDTPLHTAIKRALDKKEAGIERGMLTRKFGETGSIFSLKQLGWTDNLTIRAAGDIPDERKKEIDAMFNNLGLQGR